MRKRYGDREVEYPLTLELGQQVAETFSAMGDTTRALILLTLRQGERCVSDLAGALGVSESSVSQHLRLLRTLRLVRPRRQGRNVFYRLDDHHVEALLQVCLEHVFSEQDGSMRIE